MSQRLEFHDPYITNGLSEYRPLVKRIAYHMLTKLPANVQIDDLIQSGMIGLLEALQHYDKQKGASFETYAGIRIRGSILDEIRRYDWMPRSVHRNSRKINHAISVIEHQTGRDARDQEVAHLLGLSLQEYHQMVLDSLGGKIFGLDDLAISEELLLENALAQTMLQPSDGLKIEQIKQFLMRGIDGLPARERTVLILYYDEEKNLKEIGALLGVTESRVCQIHGQAMDRLKHALTACLS